MTNDLPDGIYFRLPMEDYVAQPRLGAHGLGNLLVSPATFWERSWLNATPRKVSAAVEATRTTGSAYHTARLELEHFADRYVRKLDEADMPEGSLFTGAEMGRALAEMGLPKSGSVAEQAARLVEGGFDPAKLWHIALPLWEADLGGRIPLSAETWDQIVTDGERLRQSPAVAALLDGGHAEVSILWTDEKGVRCKCRTDKLKSDMWLDLKTFANPNGKHLEQAISDAIRFSRYYVGAAHYRDGIEMIRGGNLEIIGEATDDERALIAAIEAQPDELACWYVFQEKSGIPNILAKRMCFHEVPLNTTAQEAIARTDEGRDRVRDLTRQPALWFERARREIRKAKRSFKTYSAVYEPGQPWLPFQPLGEISDLSFGSYFLDEDVGD